MGTGIKSYDLGLATNVLTYFAVQIIDQIPEFNLEVKKTKQFIFVRVQD